MEMSEFVHTKVDPNRLSTASGNIDNSLNMLDNAFKAIDEALRVTLHPTWSGPASIDFYKQYEMDTQTFNSHVTSLRSINNQLKEAAGIYDKADNRAKDLVNSLAIGTE